MSDILVIEDEVVLARSIVTFLERRGFSGVYAVDASSAKIMFEREKPRLVILDYKLGSDNGLELLLWIRDHNPEAQVVMMTGHGDVGIAVQAMKAGARDFLVKPAPLETIVTVARDLMLDEVLDQGNKTGADRIVGRSSVATELRTMIRNLAVASASAPPPPVLISGPRGAGKSFVARALHEASTRSKTPFTQFDCSLSEQDQVVALSSALDCAQQGTILLRNIDALLDSDQALLLARLLQNATDNAEQWILSTTTRNLAEQQREGQFREELLYRIQVGWIEVLSLEERPADILPISETIARRIARHYSLPRPRFTPEARAKLLEHPWPGNVRELANCIERAMLNAADNRIDAMNIRLIGTAHTGEAIVPNLQKLEENALEKALEVSGGNVSRAAQLLGISRDTMRYRMEKFGLSRR